MTRNGILGTVFGAVTPWLAWLFTSESDPQVRAYRRATQRLQWHALAAFAIYLLVATPLLLSLEARWITPNLDEDANVLRSFRLFAAAGAVGILALYATRLRSARTSRLERGLAHVILTGIVLVATASTIALGTQPASISVYATTLLIMVLLAFAEPRFVAMLIVASATAIVVATVPMGGESFSSTTAIYNVARISPIALVMYVAYDRMRFLLWRDRRRLRELNDLKDTVFHALAHDLRTPLHRASVAANLLESDQDEVRPLEVRHAARWDVATSLEQASLVIDNLVAITEGSELGERRSTELVAVADCLERAAHQARHVAANKGVRLHVDVEDPDVLATGSSALIVGILRNLVTNAIKYSPPDATVRMSARTHARSVTISVEDEGVGMTPDTLRAVRRGTRVRGTLGTHDEPGSGIGLLVARTFAGALGSDLDVVSVPNVGTTVAFELARYAHVKRA